MPKPIPTLTALPTELHLLVGGSLDLPSIMCFRLTNRHFYSIFPSLNHTQLLEVERSDFGRTRNLHACKDCVRLRPRNKFGDSMISKTKARAAFHAYRRFCLDCGINPPQGGSRYTCGTFVFICDDLYMACPARGLLQLMTERRFGPACDICWRVWRKKKTHPPFFRLFR